MESEAPYGEERSINVKQLKQAQQKHMQNEIKELKLKVEWMETLAKYYNLSMALPGLENKYNEWLELVRKEHAKIADEKKEEETKCLVDVNGTPIDSKEA